MNLDKAQNGLNNVSCALIQNAMFCMHSEKEPLALCRALYQVALTYILSAVLKELKLRLALMDFLKN